MNEKKKEEAACCLDADVGVGRYVLYIGAAGCFCFSFLGFATYFFPEKPLAHLYGISLAVVFGIVALGLGILMLVASRQG